MRSSCIIKGNCQQSFPSWFLLAGCSRGSRAVGEVLQRLSDVQSKKSSTSSNTENNPNSMAVCSMGTGHGWSVQKSKKWNDASSGGSGQIYQVDRGSPNQEARWSDCGSFCGRFGVPIWCAQ